jgi:phosphoribosylformylglycinamidine synthase
VHSSELISGEATIDGSQGLVIPGGFSYGDIIRAGALFASELRVPRAADQLNTFAEAGKPIIGTCNGDQVLIELGLLPNGHIDDLTQHDFTLAPNQNAKFECRWTRLRVEGSACPFIPDKDIGTVIELPVAHAEGRLRARHPLNHPDLIAAGQVVLRYCDESGEPTEDYPANPNGSPYGIAALCSPSGTIFGMMPHDERASRREHHPNWRRPDYIPPERFEAKILAGAVRYTRES